jgi:hypothetical protein
LFHLGTDEKTLISILTERSNAQRQLIVKEYQAAYEKVGFGHPGGWYGDNRDCAMIASARLCPQIFTFSSTETEDVLCQTWNLSPAFAFNWLLFV